MMSDFDVTMVDESSMSEFYVKVLNLESTLVFLTYFERERVVDCTLGEMCSLDDDGRDLCVSLPIFHIFGQFPLFL